MGLFFSRKLLETHVDLQAFWDVATPQTLASLIVDIDYSDKDSDDNVFRSLVMTQLVAIVGEEDAVYLISVADARR